MSVGSVQGDVRIGDFAPPGCGIDYLVMDDGYGTVQFEARITFETADLDVALVLAEALGSGLVPLHCEVWGKNRQRRGHLLEFRVDRRRDYKGRPNVYRVDAVIKGLEPR